jgi:gamma-tubulin complex component 5
MLERDDEDEDDWNHSRALTSFAQEAFAAHLDTTRLSVSLATTGLAFGAHDETPRGLVRRRLAGIRPHYQLSWPIEMIILPEAIPRYQAVFTLLLQLRQATCALGDERMLLLPYHEEPQSRCAQNPGYFLLRAKMLWFCTTIRSYLTTLVLAPACMQLREALRQAEDVDAIISVHVAFAARVFDEACLGSKLDPIREAMIDIFELAVRLNRAVHRLNKPEQAHKEWSNDEDDDGGVGVDVTDESGRQKVKLQRDRDDKPLAQILREIKDELERQVRFVVVGLRGVARSTSGGAAAKWDLLAQMLETGSR